MILKNARYIRQSDYTVNFVIFLSFLTLICLNKPIVITLAKPLIVFLKFRKNSVALKADWNILINERNINCKNEIDLVQDNTKETVEQQVNSIGPDASRASLTKAKNKNTNGDQSDKFKQALLSLQNPHLFGGDIVLLGKSVAQNAKIFIKYARSALVSDTGLWANGKIFYELDDSVLHIEDLILKSMSQFHESTCIRFEPKLADEPDYLKIEAVNGCFSYIGRIGGEQTLSLEGAGCEYPGTIAHELMHAVGFYHQQNRSDRDEYLDIFWDNIAHNKQNQFYKMAPQENRLVNEFDYDSIMLYGPQTFGKNFETATMKAKRKGVVLKEIIEKQGLSSSDISSINKLYNCSSQ